MENNSKSKITPYLYLVPCMLIFGIFLFYPFVKTIYLSLYKTNKMGQAKLYVGLGNYKELLQSASFINSLKVTLIFVLIVVVSLPLGLLSANGKLDGLHTFLNQFCMAVPPFFTGILISWCFGIFLRAFVPGDFPGLDRNLGKSLVYLFFAAVSIAIPRVAMTVRMLRSTVISEMNKPYVRTAIARGNDRRQVLWGHVLKNSLVPTVTFLGQTMAEIVAGSIVVEQVFSVPGLGRMLVASISSQDYPVVEAIVVILAFWVVLSGTLADLVNRCIDPRMGGIGK